MNLAITTCSTVKFKDIMTYLKLNDVVTMFKEAFITLVIESNLNWLIYLEKKENIEKKTLLSVRLPNNEICNKIYKDSLIESLIGDNSYDYIPDVLYQDNISKSISK